MSQYSLKQSTKYGYMANILCFSARSRHLQALCCRTTGKVMQIMVWY